MWRIKTYRVLISACKPLSAVPTLDMFAPVPTEGETNAATEERQGAWWSATRKDYTT